MTVKNYAQYAIATGLIENVTCIDDEIEPTIVWPDGIAAVEIPESVQGQWSTCGSGWSYINGNFIEPALPTPVVIPPTAAANKAKAIQLLAETDWVSIADVGNSQISNPYLTNQNEFFVYRNALRTIAINPVDGVLTWPTKPTEVWSA